MSGRGLVLILTIFGATAGAQPVVIYDSGATFSLDRYRPALTIPKTKRPITPAPKQVTPYPITTPELMPGLVLTRNLAIPQLPRPVFLVGDDAKSLRWLQRHHLRLKAIKAVGLVVNTRDETEVKRLREAAPGVVMSPAPASDLARRLNLRHYPVLISRRGLEQ